MRRMLLVLAAMVVMAAMLAATALPVFAADEKSYSCFFEDGHPVPGENLYTKEEAKAIEQNWPFPGPPGKCKKTKA